MPETFIEARLQYLVDLTFRAFVATGAPMAFTYS